ncbi:ABC transporter ATP-binding protein [Miniphocaeibacter massiliensis]|uniref:ABC transporter ATP-binding protein n=1 Tax=Miniphocaeibacter massiliensis TaxID=2041841 RepID=UPI000C1BDB68|nr:ABC transporter ATP-binding protein [Miniphocaeibacter massiliensis]
MEKVLEIKNIDKSYGKHLVIKNVNLTVNKGDIYGLIGKNGSGKTTLFKIIMGLSKQSKGSVNILGSKDNASLEKARKNIGFFIGSNFFPYLTARENINYYRKIKGIKDKSEIDRVLKIVELDKVNKKFKDFSMGMKQRLGIANAILGNPKIVILDEPINGLDPQGIVDIRNTLHYLQEEYGTTLMVSSHILSELELVANKFGFINKGTLVRELSREELRNEAKSFVSLRVDDSKSAINILENMLNIDGLRIESNLIKLPSEYAKTTDVINEKLVKNNIRVYEILVEELTLENYYFNLIGEGKNV